LPGGTRKVANTVSAQEKERITGEVIPCYGFRQAER
jgi:hypothetical protein